MSNLVEPRTISGFRDYPPALMIPRERVLQTAREVYRSYGYSPIDTPAVESLDVLLGKGGEESDKLVYRVRNAKSEKEEMGLRFDLTVPFARFSAKHVNESGLPFKRYAMGPVWRGERPGQGRYREFWQCDFDTIGTTSNAADIETILVIHDLFESLSFKGKFLISINNRSLLRAMLITFGLEDKTLGILRAIDKLAKIGDDGVMQELVDIVGVAKETSILLLNISKLKGNNVDILNSYETLIHSAADGHLEESPDITERAKLLVSDGTRKLKELLYAVKVAGIQEDCIRIDLSIARGLDYYTGIIFETTLKDLPGIGSVCSGGRYDDLASLYTKQVLPGVGASLGVDRLLAAMEELKHPWLNGATTAAPVLVLNLGMEFLGEYHKLARSLRAAGIGAEVYPDAKKLGPQFQYAEKRGHKLAVIVGQTEIDSGEAKLKNLSLRKEDTVKFADLPAACQAALDTK